METENNNDPRDKIKLTKPENLKIDWQRIRLEAQFADVHIEEL